MSDNTEPGWRRQGERSNRTILRLMVWISLHCGRRLSRVVLYGIAAYFTLFSPRARRAGRAYLTRALGRPASWRDSFRQMLAFASTIHDRVYLLNNRFDLFEIEVVGAEPLQAALAGGSGVLLTGAHFGSFEALRAAGRGLAGVRVAMLMYEENARKINDTLAAINPAASQDVIALGRMDSMLEARERLAEGYLVGMLADRRLANDATVERPFLGTPAAFPLGPWRLAAMLGRPVFFMAGVYLGGNRYRLHFEPLADFTGLARAARQTAIEAAAQAYAATLEQHCRRAPYNWFNFFDFWQEK